MSGSPGVMAAQILSLSSGRALSHPHRAAVSERRARQTRGLKLWHAKALRLDLVGLRKTQETTQASGSMESRRIRKTRKPLCCDANRPPSTKGLRYITWGAPREHKRFRVGLPQPSTDNEHSGAGGLKGGACKLHPHPRQNAVVD